jgi:hypothetical protein
VKGPRRPLALKLAACTLAGAALTAAVAFVLNIVGLGTNVTGLRPVWVGPIAWPTAVPSTWPARPIATQEFAICCQVAGVWTPSFANTRTADSTAQQHSFRRLTVGWPSRALAYHHWKGPDGVRSGGLVHIGSRWIAAAPIWPGFALNTAFYGAIIFALWSAPAVIRRRFRKRGHCPACGYDLRGSATGPCPECGA